MGPPSTRWVPGSRILFRIALATGLLLAVLLTRGRSLCQQLENGLIVLLDFVYLWVELAVRRFTNLDT